MNIFKTVRQPFFSADNGGGDDLQSGKTFTQEDVDRIVGERLSREKASKADYEDLKEIADSLEVYGYTGSVADKKALFKQHAEAKRQAEAVEALEEEAIKSGSSPEMLARLKKAEELLEKIQEKEQKQQQEMENKQKVDEAWNQQTALFQEKYPDVDMPKLAENERFMKFLRSSTLPFVEAYEDYIDLVGGAEKAAVEKIKANDDRSTFSGKAKAEPSGGTHGLTDNQQSLAKKNGMTNKEYADLYKQIPEK